MYLIHDAIGFEVCFSLLDYLLQDSLPSFIVYLVCILAYEPLSEHIAQYAVSVVWKLLPHHRANQLLLVFSSVKPDTVLLELFVQVRKVSQDLLHQWGLRIAMRISLAKQQAVCWSVHYVSVSLFYHS